MRTVVVLGSDQAGLELILEAIGVAPDVQGHGVVQQPIEDGGGDDPVTEDMYLFRGVAPASEE